MTTVAQRLIDWHCQQGRHDLPWQVDWQQTRDPYRVWLSEIMLQQTQVATVIGYYTRFLQRFPTLASLAAADIAEVMPLWSGLGYYARARNLHACARRIVATYGGKFPRDPALIATLPGIGRSTANAIAAFCFAARVPILDGNVKRVLTRLLGIDGYPGTPAVEKRLWLEAEKLLPPQQVAIWIQAQMDLGATVCTRTQPHCAQCPLTKFCVAYHEERTATLPAPRPKKALPEKSVTVLVLHDAQGRILLEKRPPSGIWGGLLSLPELPEGRVAIEYCRNHLGVAVDSVSSASTFRHAFTHFRLTLHPLVGAAVVLPVVAETDREWYPVAALADAALPTPIRKILAALSATP